MAKVNKHIQRIFGEILQREADIPKDVLVTVSQVDTTHNLRAAKVWIYISPPGNEQKVMKKLKKQMYDLQGSFNRAVTLHPMPRLSLIADHGADYAESIERTIRDLE